MAKGPVAHGLGRAEALSDAGEYAAALEELEAASAAEPHNAAVFTARGWALENLGPERLGEARLAYEAALTLDPSAMWAKEGLSNVLRRMGDGHKADRLCEEVVKEGRQRYEAEEDLWELVGWCELRLAGTRTRWRRSVRPSVVTVAGSRSASTSPWPCSAQGNGLAPSSSIRAGSTRR